MAAEKLTKHRLAQILITLTLLIIAFFWRTVTYTDIDTVDCALKPNCSVIVNGQKITVTKDDKNSRVITLYPIQPEWDIKYDGQVINNGNTTTLIPNNNTVDTGDSLTINESLRIVFEL